MFSGEADGLTSFAPPPSLLGEELRGGRELARLGRVRRPRDPPERLVPPHAVEVVAGLHAHRVAGGQELDRHGLLALGGAHDAPEPLHEHALGRGGREVHHHRGARLVPALGEQVRVAEHVDLAASRTGRARA